MVHKKFKLFSREVLLPSFLLFLLLIPLASSLGRLNTPSIGGTINLTEKNSFESNLAVSNNANNSVRVNFIVNKSNFIDIETGETLNLEPILLYNEFILTPGELKVNPLKIVVIIPGKYEGHIDVLFTDIMTNQNTAYASKIQINAFEGEFGTQSEENPSKKGIITGIVIFLILISIVIAIALSRNESLKEEGNQ